MVDELIARNGVDPWRQRLGWVVGVTPGVDRHQRLLRQIFRLRGTTPDAPKPALVVGTQVGTQMIEQCAIRLGIAGKARLHQSPELSLVRCHGYLSCSFGSDRTLV